MNNLSLRETLAVFPKLLKWLFISLLVGALAGSASAFFLHALAWATGWREDHAKIIWLLPLAGFVIAWIYLLIGKNTEKGNDLLLDEIHDPKATVPLRMAPLILVATILTHFFGGSAGREGTAVQMGGSLADQLTGPLHLSKEERRILLMAGISAGFGSVFGTPLAGAIFGLEVLAIGRLRYEAIFPCLFASLAGDQTAHLWGIRHEIYQVSVVPSFTAQLLVAVCAAGMLFGLTGMGFAGLTHRIQKIFKKFISFSPIRPLVGGALVALAVAACGTTRYIGLGLPVITEAFRTQLSFGDFLAKIGFTAVTLGSGFKGGEVTPLFYIGATLGNALSPLLALPAPFLASLGFVAVFAGAANTPVACTFLAMELFGSEVGLYAAIACVVSYLFSGHAGIYRSQKIEQKKFGGDL